MQDADGACQEPTEDDVRAIVQEVQQWQWQEPEQQGATTMASRVRDAHDPLTASDPWTKDEEAAHTTGIRLVIEKNLNVQKFAGEQDKSNKID